MQFNNPLPTNSGTGRFFIDGEVHEGTWRLERCADGPVIQLDGRDLIVNEQEHNLGFIYRSPDSGSEMTNIMVLLEDGEPDPVGIPTREVLSASLGRALMQVLISVSAGRTDPDDLHYARQLFSNPACLLRSVQKHGTVDAARTSILREIFRIG
jgi:hypothetical protein